MVRNNRSSVKTAIIVTAFFVEKAPTKQITLHSLNRANVWSIRLLWDYSHFSQHSKYWLWLCLWALHWVRNVWPSILASYAKTVDLRLNSLQYDPSQHSKRYKLFSLCDVRHAMVGVWTTRYMLEMSCEGRTMHSQHVPLRVSLSLYCCDW